VHWVWLQRKLHLPELHQQHSYDLNLLAASLLACAAAPAAVPAKPLPAAPPLLPAAALLPNAPVPPLLCRPPGLLLMLVVLLLTLPPSRPNKLLLLVAAVLALLPVATEPRAPGCALLAAAAAADGDPKLPKPLVHPANRDAPIKAAVLLALLLPEPACAVLLPLPAPGFGEPASTGSRMCASRVLPVGDCGLPGPNAEPPGGLVLTAVGRLPGLGDPRLPLLVVVRAVARARLLKVVVAGFATTPARVDAPVPGLLLLLAAPLP
jgi:hypothetical protein